MLINKSITPVIIRITAYFLNYISYFFLTFIACEIITIIFITIINTPLEKIFIMIISYTPTLGLWGKDTFSLGVKEVMQFFAFWSFVTMIIHNIIKRFLSIEIHIKFIVVIFTFFHLVAIFRTVVDGLLPIVAFFYISSLISLSMYLLLNKISGFIYQIPKKMNKL